MVPLHAAFSLNQLQWQQQFSEHFHRLIEQENEGTGVHLINNRLNRLQYLYLASRFLVLASKDGKEAFILSGKL